MLRTHFFHLPFLFIFLASSFFSFVGNEPKNQPAILAQATSEMDGAWRLTGKSGQAGELPEGAMAVKIVSDGYFTVTYFDKEGRNFIGTYGGTYTLNNNKLTEKYEFNTFDSTLVGTTHTLTSQLKKENLQLKGNLKGKSINETWERINEGSTASPLEGAWRISGRAGQDGKINTIQRGPRKTIKVLSDSRFQWIAFNTETKQFMGTGGGTYSAKDGRYTENIEFFSRDGSRVGASLTFDFEVKDGKWLHSGLSSTGNKISEVWEKE